MKISMLGSGSSGNATFIETEGVKFLIDAGFSGKRIKEKLIEIGEDIEDIEAILITHEHGDHIKGAGILSRKYNIPIYITKESYEAGINKIGDISSENLKFLEGDFKLSPKIKVRPFDVMHDAVRTVGFRIVNSVGKKIAVATDIGYVDNLVKEYFREVDVMIIESNYDFMMLMECRYPMNLKDRVKSNSGHLSNRDAAKFICENYHEGLKKVYLAHVSKDSNNYEVAFKTVMDELECRGLDVEVEMAYQDKVTDIYKI